MSVRVKICGVNDSEAFDAAQGAGADWIGFNFFPRSPRFVTPEQAASLATRRIVDGPLLVGLFVEPEDETVAATLTALPLDALQIYAAPERAAALRARFDRPVWHAVGVATRADLPRAASGIDRLVIEAKPPRDATRPGGNAVRFDWTLLDGWQPPVPWMLAGGLDPANVAEAIHIAHPPAVDVASGVESAPGVKDPARIRAFVAAAKAAI